MKINDLYRGLSVIFSLESSNNSGSRTQKALYLIWAIQVLSQNLKFIWKPDLSIPYWESQAVFWKILLYPCLDTLAAAMNVLFPFLMIVIGMIYLNLFIFIWQMIASIKKKTIPTWLLSILRNSMKATCDIYFIPVSTILILLFKYSTIQAISIQEYYDKPDAQTLNISVIGRGLSLVTLIMHISLTFINESFNIQVRHVLTGSNLSARSSSEIDMYVKFFYLANCYFTTSIQLTNYMIFLPCSVIIYAYFTMKYLIDLPYYSNFVNFLKILIHFEICCIGLFFILAQTIENATISLVLTVCMQPVIVLVCKLTLEYRISKLKHPKDQIFSKRFELNIRKWLTSPDNSAELVKYMNSNYIKSQNKLMLVFLANYCKDVLNNGQLAGVKISQITFNGADLFNNFQVYRCQKSLERLNLSSSEGLKLCLFLLKYDSVTIEEKKLCYILLNLLEKLVQRRYKFSEIKQELNKFHRKALKVYREYEYLAQNFPESQLINKVFASFLIEILNNNTLAEVYTNKVQAQTARRKGNDRKLDVFSDPNACLMIISGNKKQIGKFIYASSSLCRFLEVSLEDIKHHSLNDFIPKPYSIGHDAIMIKFIENSYNQFTMRCLPLFMCTQEGFLLECIINTECVGFNSCVNFVTVVEPVLNEKQEIALVSSLGEIFSHSRGFPLALGQKNYKLIGSLISDFISNESFIELMANKASVVEFFSLSFAKHINIVLLFKEVNVFKENSGVFMLTVVEDESEKIRIVEAIKNKHKSQYLEVSNIVSTFKVNDSFALSQVFASEDKFLDVLTFNRSIFDKTKSTGKYTSSLNAYKTNVNNFTSVFSIYKVFKITGVLGVFSVILPGIALLAFVAIKISHSSDLSAFNHIDIIYSKFSELGLFVRSIDLSLQLNESAVFSLENINNVTKDIQNVREKIKNDYEAWKFCKYSEIVNSDIISIYTQGKEKNLGFTNLLDLIDDTGKNVRNI